MLVAIAVPLAFAPSALAAEGGRITGTVTLPGGWSPSVEDVNVCAYTLNGTVSACGNPEVFSGEYAIEGLAGGEYKVGFSSLGLDYLNQFYDDVSTISEAQPVSVTVGQTTSEIDAELHTAGEISGRVTNAATSAPIQGVQVCAEPSVFSNCEWTDVNGEYTISGLASGEYKVGFTPGELDYFLFRTTVSVTAGQVTSGVDAPLVEGGRITGTVTDASTGEPIEGAEACAREVGGDGERCGSTNANGEYRIARLNGPYRVGVSTPLAHYLSGFYGGQPPSEYGWLVFSPSQEVTVSAPSTLSGVDVALQPGVFAEPVSTAPPVVSGTAAVGSALSCSPGSWTGNPAPTLAYKWLRDGSPIVGATQQAYTAQSADEGHNVSCRVIAFNAAGYQQGAKQATSASVLIAAGTVNETPPGGPGAPTLPTETTTGLADSTSLAVTPFVTVTDSKLMVSGGSAPVHVECSQAICQGLLELTVQVPENGKGKTAANHKATLILAAGSFSLTEGKRGTVLLRLTATGRRMLAHAGRRHPIAVKLILSGQSGKTATRSVLVG